MWINARTFTSTNVMQILVVRSIEIKSSFIHPSILFHSSGARSRWQQAKQGIPDVPLRSNVFLLLQGDPEALLAQMRYVILQCFGSAPGSPTSWTYLENLQEKTPRRHPDNLNWLLSTRRSSGSTPSSLQMSELLTLSLKDWFHWKIPPFQLWCSRWSCHSRQCLWFHQMRHSVLQKRPRSGSPFCST